MATENLDKRQYPRFSKVVYLEYSPVTKYNYLTKVKKTITRNLGEGGVCFNTADLIRENSTISLLMSLPESPVKAEGKIVWVKKEINRKTESYRIGVRFTNIDPYSRSKIAKLEWS